MLQADHGFNNFPFNQQVGRRTPNRHRPPVYNHQIGYGQPLSREEARSLSPNKLNATKKPMISQPMGMGRGQKDTLIFNQVSTKRQRDEPLLSHRSKNSQKCENHPSKPAEFIAIIQGERIKYCQKCAINVASNGFEVIKINSQSPKMNNSKKFFLGSPKSKLQPFNFPEFSSMRGYSQLKEIIGELDQVYFQYQDQIGVFGSMERHYETQYNLTENFYEELLKIIEQMKEDHLNDLVDISKKQIQLAYIKEDHLKNDVEEMEIIRNDLMDSVEDILEKYEDPVTQKNLSFYKQQVYVFGEKVAEEKVDFEKELIDYSVKELENRMKVIQEFLLDVWNMKDGQDKPEAFEHEPRHHRSQGKQKKENQSPMNNIIHLGEQAENRKEGSACRKLFDEEEEKELELGGEISPQFKKF